MEGVHDITTAIISKKRRRGQLHKLITKGGRRGEDEANREELYQRVV